MTDPLAAGGGALGFAPRLADTASTANNEADAQAWRSIFERAEAVGHRDATITAPQARRAAPTSTAEPASGADRTAPMPAGQGSGPGAAAARAACAAAAAGSAAPNTGGAGFAHATNDAGTATSNIVGGAMSGRAPPQHADARRSASPSSGAAPSAAASALAQRVAPALPALLMAAASAATVTVHADGAAVSIAVRDMTLTDDEALRCAFEAASQIAGRRAALQALVLNGRTLYRGPDASPDADAANGRASGFVC